MNLVTQWWVNIEIRFISKFHVFAENLAILEFYEVVLEYREILLFKLEFTATDWDKVCSGVRQQILDVEVRGVLSGDLKHTHF